jgi:MSHA biogenesis protein MshJ
MTRSRSKSPVGQKFDMKMMKPKELVQKFEESSLREQVLIGVTGAVAVVFALQFLIMDPLISETEKVKRRVVSLSNTQMTLQKKLTDEPKEKSELREKKKEFLVQRQRVAELDRQLSDLSSLLVAPDVMPNLLRSLVATSDMKMVAFENMAPQPLLAPEKSSAPIFDYNSNSSSQVGKPLQLFRHGMSLQLRGSFSSSLKYLKSVESQPWGVVWNSLDYEVDSYPNGNLTIKIETLSTDQHWLGV